VTLGLIFQNPVTYNELVMMHTVNYNNYVQKSNIFAGKRLAIKLQVTR